MPIHRYAAKSKGKDVMYSTHVLPRLASSGDAIHLGWVEAINGGPAVSYFVATSTDGGLSFSEPIPVQSAEAVKPGFTSLTAGLDGSIVCGWLDSRAKGARPYSSVKRANSDGFEAEQLAYEGPEGKGVCPCCDVAVAQTQNGARFVAFRNSDSGNRDIYVASPNGLVAVAPDHWKLDGCPHDGPSMALVGDRLNIVWMDAHTGKNRIYHASSPTDGLAFVVRELAIDSNGAQGHPKLASTRTGSLLAVWDESIGEAPAPPSGASQGHGPRYDVDRRRSGDLSRGIPRGWLPPTPADLPSTGCVSASTHDRHRRPGQRPDRLERTGCGRQEGGLRPRRGRIGNALRSRIVEPR